MKVKTVSPSLALHDDNDSEASLGTVPNARAGRMLKAAGEVFLSRGYAGASLETIVAKSGGSLRDLYQVFGNKEALFMRVMGDLCAEVLAPLRDLAMDAENRKLPVEEALKAIGRTLVRVLLSPRALSLHRLVVSESPRFPALGQSFFQEGPSHANETIAAFLEDRAGRGELAIGNTRAAGAAFLHAVVSGFHLRAITGGRISRTEVEAHIQEAVRIFLDGARARALPPG